VLRAEARSPDRTGCGRSGSAPPADVPDSDFFTGDLDELRIERVGHTAAWMRYSYRAQLDQVITSGPNEH